MKTTQKNKKIPKGIDIEEFKPEQARLIRSILVVISSLLQAKEEDVFFNNSAELIRLSASLVKQSDFTKNLKIKNNIPFSEQALEYSLDVLQECMNTESIVVHDN